jgi:hypothetical protein
MNGLLLGDAGQKPGWIEEQLDGEGPNSDRRAPAFWPLAPAGERTLKAVFPSVYLPNVVAAAASGVALFVVVAALSAEPLREGEKV